MSIEPLPIYRYQYVANRSNSQGVTCALACKSSHTTEISSCAVLYEKGHSYGVSVPPSSVL